jgi:hypothetical protein
MMNDELGMMNLYIIENSTFRLATIMRIISIKKGTAFKSHTFF